LLQGTCRRESRGQTTNDTFWVRRARAARVEYAFGKVPDKIESTGLENKKTLILHYGHEFDRLKRERRLGNGDERPKN
jgi:hypothetical protein